MLIVFLIFTASTAAIIRALTVENIEPISPSSSVDLIFLKNEESMMNTRMITHACSGVCAEPRKILFSDSIRSLREKSTNAL